MAKKTNQTSKQTTLPGYLNKAYKGILQAGAEVAKQPLEQYTGSRTAGFTPMQQQGFQQISNAQGMGLPFINAAADAYGGVQGIDWSGVGGSTVDYSGLGQASRGISGGLNFNSIPRNTVNAQGVNRAARGVTGATNWGAVPGSTLDPNAVNNASQGITGGLNWGSIPGSTIDPSGIGAASQGVTNSVDWSGIPNNTLDEATIRQGQGGISDQLNWSGVPSDTVDWNRLGAASGAVMPGVDQYNADTMSRYMDPYLEGVIDPMMERMSREDAKQISDLKGSGISMGISPSLGDRMGLAASDLSGQQALARNQVLGGLYSQGFQNAQQQLSQQQQLQLQGGTSDQARLLEAANLATQGRQADADRILQGISQKGGFMQGDQQRLLEAANLMQQGKSEDANRILQSLSTQSQNKQQDQGRLMEAQQMLQSGKAEDAARALQTLTTQGNFSQADQGRLMEAQQMLQSGRQEDAARILQSLTTQNASRQQDQGRLMEAQQMLQSGRQEDAARALQTLTTKGQFSQADQDRLMQAQTLMQQGRSEDASRLLQSLMSQQQGGLAAAQGIAGLGQQAQDMTMQGIDYMMNAGQMQQALGQQQLDQTYADWQARQDYPKSQVDWLANLIYGSPGAAATTTTTQQPAPSWISQIAGLGTAAAGLFGARRGGAIRRAPGGMVPHIDVNDFQVDSFGWPAVVPSGLEPAKNGVYEGDWYINALPNLTPRQVGNDPRVTKLPKDIREIFSGIGRGASGKNQSKDTEITKDGRPIIRRWPDGTIKTIGGKPVKHARGGAVHRAPGGMVPGTPEYDAEVKRLLTGEGVAAPPVTEASEALPPPSTEGLGAIGSERPSFFENKNLPLIYAGLGIAAGESPYPLQNIGSGALAGLTAAQSLHEKEMGLDDNPVVDDSGPTIRIWYPSEKRWEDTGIPTARWEAAAGESGEKTETERYLAAKWGEDWKSNPEAISEWTTIQSKPATSITTNVDTKGGAKFSEGLAEQGLEIVKEANAASSRAQDLELVATMAQNPDVYTGAVGESIDSLKRFAGTVLGLQVEGVPEGEIIRQAQAQAVGRLRGLLPGPMSDGDRAFLLAATPGLSNSTGGIMLAAELARMQADSMSRKKNKLMQLMRDAERDPEGSSTDALIGFQEWMDQPENRVFTPETLAEAQKRAAARATEAGGQHKPTAGTGAVWEKYGVPPPGGAP